MLALMDARGVWRPCFSTRTFVMAQSNFDRRRINGPDETSQPVFDSDDEEETRWRPGNPRKRRGPREIRRI